MHEWELLINWGFFFKKKTNNSKTTTTTAAVDVTAVGAGAGYEQLCNAVSRSSLVLCCVDNYQARLAVNQACLEANKSYFEVCLFFFCF